MLQTNIFITIDKQDEPIIPADNVLAVDYYWYIAVTVNTVNTKPNFYCAELRGIRGFYFNLRRKLGEKKAYDKIKSLKNIEFLRVNHELHEISKTIVEEAKRTNAIIVLGKLRGIRKNIKGSRRMRRLINNFPYYRLVQYIKYKAAWTSIRTLEISEAPIIAKNPIGIISFLISRDLNFRADSNIRSGIKTNNIKSGALFTIES
jgi:putative transposase